MEKNKLLIVFCLIGCILYILFFIKLFFSHSFDLPSYFEYLNFFIWPVIIVGTVLTYNDVVKIGTGNQTYKEKTFDVKTWSPITWALIVLILYPFSLPLYIHYRNVLSTKKTTTMHLVSECQKE